MGIVGNRVPFDLVVAGRELLANRYHQQFLVGGIGRSPAGGDEFSGLVLNLDTGQFRDEVFVERDPHLLRRRRSSRSGSRIGRLKFRMGMRRTAQQSCRQRGDRSHRGHLRVCPRTSGRIAEISEHEAD